MHRRASRSDRSRVGRRARGSVSPRSNPAWPAAEVDAQGGVLALNQLAVGRFDAVIWVTDPNNLEQTMLQALNANSALGLIPVKDERLLEPLSDGTVVYTKRKVRLTGGWPAKKVETICTSALVLMRKDDDATLVSRVANQVGLHLDSIVPPTTTN